VLYVRDTVIVPSSGQPIFTIDGTLQLAVTAQHSYKNIRTELGAPATVSGTNASQFIELPTASAGDIQQYDGQRYQLRYHPRYVKTTEDLAALVAAASAGDQFILAPGTHTLSGTLTITKSDIVISGPASAVVVGPAAVPAITIDCTAGNLSSIWLKDFTVQVPATGTHGISVTGANTITSTHFCLGIQRAAGTGSYGIYIHNDQWNGGEIKGSAVLGAFDNAVRIAPATGSDDSVITSNYFAPTGAASDGVYVQRGVINRLDVSSNNLVGSSTGSGIRFDAAVAGSQTLICQNRFRGFTNGVQYEGSADYINMCGNTLFGTASTAGTGIIVGSNIDHINLGLNTVKTFQYGIRAIGGVNNVSCTGNEIYDVQYGLWFPGSGGLGTVGTIVSNSIEATGSNSKQGIYVNEIFKITITGNSVKNFNDDTGADSAGIRCKSDDQIVSGNVVGDCYRGILIQNNSSGVHSACVGNSIYSCSIGIQVKNTAFKSMTVSENTIRDCTLRFIQCEVDGGESIKIDGNNCRTKSTADTNPGISVDGAISAGATSFIAVSISHNIVNEYRGTSAAIFVKKVSYATINGNVIYDGDGDGLRLETVTESVINSNRVAGHLQAGKYGLYEDANSDENTFVGNSLKGNTLSYLFGGTNGTDVGNKV
jgi:hypothetical protein